MKKINNKNQAGLAHLGLIVMAVAVLSVIGFSAWRVTSSNKTQNHIDNNSQSNQVKPLPENLNSLKTIDEVGQIAGVNTNTSIVKFVLESKDGKYVYILVLSNGKKMVIDANNGSIISSETTDISDDDKIPSGVAITLSLADAYNLASSKSSSPIKTIEMEVEDKKVVYKVEYQDGSKIEINATGGSILKSEIKGQPKQDSDDSSDDEAEDSSENEDEDEDEDHENEDSDDSQDSEDHEEEDR